MRNRPLSSLRPRLEPREHNRILPCVALAFGLGVWLAPRTAAGLWPLWLLLAAGLMLSALALLRRPRLAALLPVLIMAGLFYAQGFLQPEVPQAGPVAAITATVSGDPMPRADGRVALWLTDVSLDGESQPGKAYLTLQADSGFTAESFFDGASLAFSGSVYRPGGKQNAYDFDFRLWALQNGAAYGISTVKDLRVINTPDTAPWTDFGARIRGLCAARFKALMGEPGALAMAMLLGVRDGLSEDEQAAFQSAGVSHLMAVSGLHVALMMGALNWLLTALALRRSVRLPVMAVLVALYCALTGFSPAAVRATAMIVLWLFSQVAGRKPDPLAALSGAAVAVLLLNPLDLFSAGFALSFSAMAGILLLGPQLKALMTRRGGAAKRRRKSSALRRTLLKVFGKPTEVVGMSLAAQAGVLLPVAETFHRLPLYGLFFNLLAVPLAGLLLPLYAGTLLISLLPFVGDALGGLLGFVAARGSELLLWLVSLSQKLPFAQVRVPAPTVWTYAAFVVAIVAVSRYVRAGWAKRLSVIGLAVAIALAGTLMTRPADVRYHQLAVGQGDAALLIDGSMTAAIDVGPYGSEMADRLLAENRDLDALLLSHLHADHVAGVKQLLAEGIRIRRVYLPVTARDAKAGDEGYDTLRLLADSGVPLTYLAAGDMLTLRTVSIAVQWPEAGGLRAGRSENDDAMVTLIRMGGARILSMGDVSGLYERYAAAPCDVLKVGHHGSNLGTGDAFLAAARPAFAIVTCREGAALPGAETLARLRTHGATALRTDETGEIILEVMREGYRVTTYKAGWMNGP